MRGTPVRTLAGKTDAARASHPSRIARGSPTLAVPAVRGDARVRPHASGGVPLLPELVADHDFHHRSASNAGTSGLILSKDRIRRRPQRPGNQHALTRGLECPRRLPLALSQSSSKLKKGSRFHCRHSAAVRSCPQQENLVGLCRSCELCGLLVERDGKNRVKSVFAGRERWSPPDLTGLRLTRWLRFCMVAPILASPNQELSRSANWWSFELSH